MKTDNVTEFGLFVTSNESLSHIMFGKLSTTPCGLTHKITNSDHPDSDIRWFARTKEFKVFVDENRHMGDPGYRFCKRCLKAFDKWHNSQKK